MNINFNNPGKTIFRILLPGIATMMFSCEEVIKVDLNNAAPKIVIEGNISDQPGPYQVTLSKSINFDEPNIFPAVTGAKIIVSDNAGTIDTLKEIEAGKYQTTKLQGQVGKTYFFKATAEGTEYAASSTMPTAVPLDSISVEKSTFGPDASPIIKVYFRDPGNETNYYRFRMFVNGKESKLVYLIDDNLRQGETVKQPLRGRDEDVKLKSGDKITVIMQNLDKNVYEYMRAKNQLDGDNSASPANPKTNINNNPLGYFSAHSETSASVVIP